MLAEKQQRLIDDLLAIPDAQERLAAIVARAARTHARSSTLAPTPTPAPALAPAERTDANRVPGCVSAVWLVATVDPDTRRLRLRADADSPLVKGLVALLCDLYDDTPADEAATFHADLFEKLAIAQNLSPTRRHGLASVQARIREKAEGLKS